MHRTHSNFASELARILTSKATVVCGTGLFFFQNVSSLYAAESGAGDAKLDPLAWQTDLALWTGVVFVILLCVLWLFAFGPIVKALDLRELNEYERMAATEKANAEARELLEQYRQKLADSEDEVRRIFAQAKVQAEQQATDLLNQAREAATAERERALQDIQAASDVALHELARKSADLATNLAGKILKREIDQELDDEVIQSVISDVVS